MTPRSSSRSVNLLAAIVIFSVVSTTLHYTHNFVMADEYPPVYPFFPNSLAYRVGIVIFYPLLTWIGVRAFLRYRAGRTRGVAIGLVAYAALGWTSILHFAGGIPTIPAFFFATISTDFASGMMLLAFAALIWGEASPTGTHQARHDHV